MTEIAARLVRPIQRLGAFTVLGVCLALLLAAAGAVVGARAVMYRDAVLPGTRVAGVDVGGLTEAQAARLIESSLADRLAEPIDVSVAGERFSVEPASLFRLDADATAANAYRAARGSYADRLGALAAPFAVRQDVEPVLLVRQRGRTALTESLLSATKRPIGARVSMDGIEPLVVPGRDGTEVDEVALLERIEVAALAQLPSIEAPVASVEPELTTAEAERAATLARIAVAAPVKLSLKRKSLGRLGTETMASLVRFQPVDGDYEVTIDSRLLARDVQPLVKPFERKPVDADFRIRGERAKLVRARPGLALDRQRTAESVLEAATGPGVRAARVSLTKVRPELTTREARALGITERISTFTTDMGPSPPNRIWNVHLLGRYLDGTVIEPGKWFSYNKEIGPRTVERGFREGQMIFGGILIPSIGGGVCQTATTIFNAAFEAGLPIKERHNHSWYISHYPMGRDAAVSWGGPDLVFKNDLDHAILIKASYTNETFTVAFYGTKQKRKVVSSTSRPTNRTSPKMQYAIDPTAPRRSVRTVAGGGSGFSVVVHRKVYERGKVIRQDSFPTTYTPQNPTTVYGPGGDPPGPYFYLPASG